MTKNEMRRDNAIKEYNRLEESLYELGYKLHHTALAKGYYCIDSITLSKYKGKFGVGYIVENHADISTRYHRISYYVK